MSDKTAAAVDPKDPLAVEMAKLVAERKQLNRQLALERYRRENQSMRRELDQFKRYNEK